MSGTRASLFVPPRFLPLRFVRLRFVRLRFVRLRFVALLFALFAILGCSSAPSAFTGTWTETRDGSTTTYDVAVSGDKIRVVTSRGGSTTTEIYDGVTRHFVEDKRTDGHKPTRFWTLSPLADPVKGGPGDDVLGRATTRHQVCAMGECAVAHVDNKTGLVLKVVQGDRTQECTALHIGKVDAANFAL